MGGNLRVRLEKEMVHSSYSLKNVAAAAHLRLNLVSFLLQVPFGVSCMQSNRSDK